MVVQAAGIVGRDPELRVVRDLMDLANEGGGALLVRGDAGMGKSALLGHAADLARDAGIRVLRTVGVRTEANLPFAGLHQLLRPVLRGLAALPTPQQAALAGAFGLVEAAPKDPFLIALATLTLLADAAADGAILVLVDDAQWLDRASADAVAFVARRLGSDPLVMIVGLRDGESSPLDGVGIAELSLAPLSDRDARELVARRAPALASTVRDRIIRDAAGNPLALAELSTALGDDGEAGEDLPEVLPLTARLERTFAMRAEELPAETRWLVLVAALDDRDGVAELLAAAQVPASTLRPAVDARLLEIDAASFRFRHPLIRSAIVRQSSASDRQRAHASLAEVVGDADRVAWHRAAATDLPDESVARLLDAAAERAMGRGAFAVALDALQRAATLSEDGRGRGTRLLRAADVANDLGHMDVVAEMLRASEPIDVPELEHRRHAWLAALALAGPRSARERERIENVVASALRAGDDGQRDLGLALLQFATARAWWLDPGVETRTRIAVAARRLAPDGNDARAIYLRAIAPEADLDELLMQLLERAAAAEPASGVDGRHLATAALWVGSLDLAVELFESAISALRSEGRLGLLTRSLIVRAFSSVHLGSLGTVASDLDEGMRLAMETRQPLFVATAMITDAIYLAYRGDIAGAEARIREVERLGVGQADGVLAETRHARGIIDLAAGRVDDAYEQLRPLFDPAHPSYHPTVSRWAIADFGFAAAQAGRLDEASRVLDQVEADDVRMKMTWLRIGSSYARAAIAAERRDIAAAEQAFATARSIDLARWPLARGRLALSYGMWLRRQRRKAESRAELRSARDQLDAIGVRYLADRAQDELGASDAGRRRRGLEALDQLTPQELQIALLAADGLSNREIGGRLYLSHRTVGSHLYRVFPKLGVTSRAQLHRVLDGATQAP